MSKALKAALKAAKTSLDEGDFRGAKDNCLKVLEQDDSNYHANVFLGLALLNLGEARDAEIAYKKAISANKGEPLAWQGLASLYDKTGQIREFIDTSRELAVVFMNRDDRPRSLGAIEKMLPVALERGTKAQYKIALGVILPGSPVFNYLEGLIPNTADTYIKLAEIIEGEEKETINKEIASRRSRLGAVVGQVTLEVKREVYKKSPLEEIYQNIINWSHDADIRRKYESKQITHAYSALIVFPAAEKQKQRDKVLEWCQGMVLLKYPFELAWRLSIEWNDVDSIGELDASTLREFTNLFPTDNGLSKSIRAYMECEISPFPAATKEDADAKDSSDSEDGGGVSLVPDMGPGIGPDERLDFMIDGLEKSPKSVLCHRILGDYYLFLKEYENAVEISRKGLKLIASEENASGLSFQRNADALSVTLANALVHYRTPKYHSEATSIFLDVLSRNHTNEGALVGQGLVLEEAGDYEGAFKSLNMALVKDPTNPYIIGETAWCNVLLKNYDDGKKQLEACLEQISGDDAKSKDLRALTLWRIGSALWDSDAEGRKDRAKGYDYFLQALRSNPSFAPAYTSLGVYYEDIEEDAERASKCFQKAFELSAGEFEAAERLARAFAKDGEWEVVEIVARRAADADKKRTTPGRTAVWPQVAIGVAELNSQNFPQAIQAFQSALRNHPEDFHSWVGLGESYTSSGRYIAAMKCFKQAQKLDGDNWFVKYMLANVNKELGEYEDACEAYREVLETRPIEFGVLLALAETLVTSSWHYLQNGYYGRAANAALECLKVANRIVDIRPEAFNLWKYVGDACSVFSWIQQSLDIFPSKSLKTLLTSKIDTKEYDILHEDENVGSKELETFEELSPLTQCLYGAIFAYKRGIYSTLEDKYAHAVAWYNVGCAMYRTYIASEDEETKFRSAAVRCFKRAIKLEPRSSNFWNAFGVCASEIDPKSAQHALVRALHIDERSARSWTNLGVLYLMYGDHELANQAFSKAQSTDPEYSHAWIGQGLVAIAFDQVGEAQELFEHAFKISESFSPIVKHKYATASFSSMIQSHTGHVAENLFGPIFALRKLEQQGLNDPYVLHLSALYSERIGDFEGAVRRLQTVCEKLEERYEQSESEMDLELSAQSRADLGRAFLGKKDYGSAVENASTALDLTEDNASLTKCRLSAHLTAGLAHYFAGNMDDSLTMFKAALTESSENPDVICLLAQVLWAKGGEQEREVAREQLFACIEANPEHIPSTILLAVIGSLDNDMELVDGIMEDLLAVRGGRVINKLERDRVDELVYTLTELGSSDDAIMSSYTSAIFLRPANSTTWGALASRTGDKYPAKMALKLAQESASASSEELCRAYAGYGTIEHDQMAIFVAPWLKFGWDALAKDVYAAASLVEETETQSSKEVKPVEDAWY